MGGEGLEDTGWNAGETPDSEFGGPDVSLSSDSEAGASFLARLSQSGLSNHEIVAVIDGIEQSGLALVEAATLQR